MKTPFTISTAYSAFPKVQLRPVSFAQPIFSRQLSEPRPTLERGPLGKDNARCSASEPAFDIRGSTPAATMLSSTSFSSCFLLLLAAQVVTMRFGAIATGLHRAPAAAAVLTVIHEQKAALFAQAMPQSRHVRIHNQITR